MKKNYTFSKAKARELLLQAFGKDLDKEVKLEDVIKLFESNKTQDKNIYDDEGNIIKRKCAALNVYFPISEFGTIGKDKNGNVKYNYYSKLGQKVKRAYESELNKLKDKLVNCKTAKEMKDIQTTIKELENMSLKDYATKVMKLDLKDEQ